MVRERRCKMGRLTKRISLGNGKFTVDFSNEKCGEFLTNHKAGVKAIFEKLAEYEDLEEQGLLLKLPCKVGGTLYDIQEFVDEYDHPEIYVVDASRIEVTKDEKGFCYCIDAVDYREKHFGTVLFATKEEAEKALEEMKGD